MKVFVITSIITVVFLSFYLSLQTGSWAFSKSGQKDDEQSGLNELTIIRFSHVVAENTPKGLAAQKFAELVAQKTAGKVKVEVYANGSLYSDGEELDALLNGDIQMIAPSYTKMTSIVPDWKILDLPFLFKDDQHVQLFLDGDLDEKLLDQLDHRSLKGLAFWSNGFKQMTSNVRLIKESSSFIDQTFRVMPGDVIENQFKLLGANTVVTSFDQVYSSLERNEVNGQENTISNIYSKKLYKVQNYLTLSNHGYLGYVVMMNQDFWNALSPSIQTAVQEAMTETTAWIHQESTVMNRIQLEEIRTHSSIHIYPLEEKYRKEWMKILNPLYQEVESEVGEELLQELLLLEKYE